MLNRRKRSFNIKENLKIENVLIRYINDSGLTPKNKQDIINYVKADYELRGLYNLYSHIEIVLCDRDEVEIKQIYVRKRK